jgi:DNA-binding winged helix-turn-helix (wHTH) protein/tetratricopeptide (TPR) repeat protein
LLSFPPFRLDLENERLWKNDAEVHLRRKPFAILRHLVRNPQRLVTHSEIVEAVWGKIAMSESLLRTHLYDLRQVLGEGLVETVVGRGYRFVREVATLEPEPARGDARITSRATESEARLVVGRDAELDTLRAALRAAQDGRRTTVFVTGEAGAGKTTLVDAFLELASAIGPTHVGYGASVEQYGSGQAYLPVLDAVGALCQGRGADRAIDVFARRAPSWLVQLPGLVRPDHLEELQRRAAGATQARMVCELGEALDAISVIAPVVIAFEDLHWADPSTAKLIAFLGGRREPARMLIIGTYRPEEAPRGHPLLRVASQLIAHRQASAIALAGLAPAAVDVYLSKRFPGHVFPPELAPTLERSTGGNPLFLTTLVDDLEGQGLIRKHEGRWELSTNAEDVAARRPDSIRRLIDTQIDRLKPVDQRIIEVAGVAGMTFTAGVVAHALDADPDGVDSACESLANERRLLQHAGTETWPDGTIQSRYSFRHALFQHAALARSTAATVRARHRKIAERIETGYAGREEEVAGELAVHFENGQMPAKAARYHVEAAERAARRCGYREAVAHLEHVRELLDRTPQSRERDIFDLRASLTLGWSLFQIDGRGDLAVPALQRATELAADLEDHAALGNALIHLEAVLMAQGDLRGANRQRMALASVVDHVSQPGLRLLARQVEATTVLLSGQFEEALRLFGTLGVFRATDEKTELEAAGVHLLALAMGSFALWLTGRPDRALTLIQRAQQVAAEAFDPFEHAAMLAEGALLHVWRREPARAIELAKRTLALSEQGSFDKWEKRALLILRWAEAETARDPSRARVEELLSEPWEDGSVGRTMHAAVYVAIAARLGQTERALDVIARTLSTIDHTDERWLEPEIHRLRGEVLQLCNDSRNAEQSIRAAIDIARKQGSRLLELRATLSLHAHASGTTKERAREDLARLLTVVTEGHDTSDLIDARAAVAR